LSFNGLELSFLRPFWFNEIRRWIMSDQMSEKYNVKSAQLATPLGTHLGEYLLKTSVNQKKQEQKSDA